MSKNETVKVMLEMPKNVWEALIMTCEIHGDKPENVIFHSLETDLEMIALDNFPGVAHPLRDRVLKLLEAE